MSKRLLEDQFARLSLIVKTLIECNKQLKLKENEHFNDISALKQALRDNEDNSKINENVLKHLYQCIMSKDEEITLLKEYVSNLSAKVKILETDASERLYDINTIQQISQSINELLDLATLENTTNTTDDIYEVNNAFCDKWLSFGSSVSNQKNIQCSLESCDEDFLESHDDDYIKLDTDRLNEFSYKN